MDKGATSGADTSAETTTNEDVWAPTVAVDVDGLGDESTQEDSSSEKKSEKTVSTEKTDPKADSKEEAGKEKSTEKKEANVAPNFSSKTEKEEAIPIPKKTVAHPPLKDGDYVVVKNDDGKEVVVVKAQHVFDDYQKTLEDPRVFLKIFKSKNSDKAEFIAEKLLGFKGDDFRTPGKMAADVFKLFLDAKTDEDRKSVGEKYFPDVLKNEDAEWNVRFEVEGGGKKETGEGGEEAETPITADDIKMAMKLWKVESEINIDIEEAFENPEVFEAYEEFKFDPSTGEALSEDERIILAMDATYGDIEEPKKEVIQVGGNKKGSSKILDKAVDKKEAPKEPVNPLNDQSAWD